MPIEPTSQDGATRRLEHDRSATDSVPQGASIGASDPEKDPIEKTSLLEDAGSAAKTSLLNGDRASAAETTVPREVPSFETTSFPGGTVAPAAAATTLLDGGEPAFAHNDLYEPEPPIDETVQFGEGEVRTVGPSVYPDAYSDATVAPVGVDDEAGAGYRADYGGYAGYGVSGRPSNEGAPIDRTVAMPRRTSYPDGAAYPQYPQGQTAWGGSGAAGGQDYREAPVYDPAVLQAAAEREESRSLNASRERDRGSRLLRRGAVALVVVAVALVAISVAWEAAQGALKGFGDRIGETVSSLFDNATESVQNAGEQLGGNAADAVAGAVSDGLGNLVQGALDGAGGGDSTAGQGQDAGGSTPSSGETGTDGTATAGDASASGGTAGSDTATTTTTTPSAPSEPSTPSTETPAEPSFDDVTTDGTADAGQAGADTTAPSTETGADAGGQQAADQGGDASVTVTPPADASA